MTPAPRKASLAFVLSWLSAIMIGAALLAGANMAMARYACYDRDRRPETYISLSETAMNQGDFAAALRFWEEAFDRAPESPLVHKVRGDIHYNQNQWRDALAAYQKALEFGSTAKGVRMNALWCLVELKRYTKALEFGRLCMKEGLDDADLYRRTAEACFRGGMHAEAIPLFEKALQGYSDDLFLMEHLRQAYRAVGREEEAEKLAQKIVQLEAKSTTARGESRE